MVWGKTHRLFSKIRFSLTGSFITERQSHLDLLKGKVWLILIKVDTTPNSKIWGQAKGKHQGIPTLTFQWLLPPPWPMYSLLLPLQAPGGLQLSPSITGSWTEICRQQVTSVPYCCTSQGSSVENAEQLLGSPVPVYTQGLRVKFMACIENVNLLQSRPSD